VGVNAVYKTSTKFDEKGAGFPAENQRIPFAERVAPVGYFWVL